MLPDCSLELPAGIQGGGGGGGGGGGRLGPTFRKIPPPFKSAQVLLSAVRVQPRGMKLPNKCTRFQIY